MTGKRSSGSTVNPGSMEYVVRQSNRKVLLVVLLGMGGLFVTIYGAWLLADATIGGLPVVLLWILLGMLGLLSLLIVPLSVVLLFYSFGKAVEMTPGHIWLNCPGVGKLSLPWKEIKSFGLSPKGGNQSLLIFLRDPGRYIPPLKGFKKLNTDSRILMHGTAFTVPTRFLNRPGEDILEKAETFLRQYGR
jgi:hypothetical protein